MTTANRLTRFLEAQNGVYDHALVEIKNGQKRNHWMWYIFPQIAGLGLSETSQLYAIANKSEASEYLKHEILGKRLVQISNALIELKTNNATAIFGSIDSVKLRSSMTLFSVLENTNPVFQKVLDKFYGGMKDDKTLRLLGANT